MKFDSWICFFAVLVHCWALNSLLNCPPDCICDAQDNQIICDEVIVNYHDMVFFENELDITCLRINIKNYSILPRFNIRKIFETVSINNCTSPNYTFHQLLDYINVDNKIEYLNIRNGRDNIWSALKTEHFKNLTKVVHLKIEVEGSLKLTKDFFVEMENLKSIGITSQYLNAEKGALNSLPNLDSLVIKSVKSEHFPTDIFLDCESLVDLSLEDTIIQNANLIKYAGLNSLEELFYINIGLNELQLNNLPKLKTLEINKNNFRSFSKNSLKNVPRLKRFKMNKNSAVIRTIPSGFLGDLDDLEHVEMSNSNIENIEEGVFLNSPNILYIDLSGNALRVIPENIFKNLFLLGRIDLSENRLFRFSSRFPPIEDLSIILNHNDLHNLNLVTGSAIGSLDASYNKLDEKSIDAWIHDVKSIDISHNNIKVLSIPRSNNKQKGNREIYRVLDMSFNEISKIALDVLYNTSDFDEINLSNNAITHLEVPEDIVYHEDLEFFHPARVILENNPIICDCRYINAFRYLKKMPELFKILGENVCHLPLNLRGKSIESLDECDLICEIGDLSLCPRSCWCIYRACDNTKVIKCTTEDIQLPLNLPDQPYNIELTLENSSLISISSLGIDRASFAKITKIFLANNKISELAESDIPDNITLLDLRNNLIGYVSDEVIKKLKSPLLTSLLILGNPIICDCKNQAFLTFLQESILSVSIKVPDYYTIECFNEKKLVSSIDVEQLCSISSILIYTLATLMVTVMILLILGLLYYKYQMEVKVWLFSKGWFINWITEEEVDKDKIYDAFLSWSHKDDDFVLNTFLPELEEGPNPFKICVHHRDWNVGELITSQINRTIMESKRTIVILSPNFLTSVWGMYEFRQAHCLSLQERRNRVIVICYGDIGPKDKLHKDLQTYLSTKTYLEWGDPLFWKKLKYALPHPSPNTTIEKTVVYRSGMVEFQRPS